MRVNPSAWSSLDDELAVAVDLFGESRGKQLVADWLATETSRTSDRDFAREFSDHISLPDVGEADYLHRIVHTPCGDLLGGIRFRGRDISRPFVEIVAHGFGDLDALRDCVRGEWSAFAPEFLRLCARPGRIDGPGVSLDLSIYVARHEDLGPVSGRITLRPFGNADTSITMVIRRYERLAVDDPEVARNVAPAAPDDLRHWRRTGRLRAIIVDDMQVGLLAVAPGSIRWIVGDEINEEVVDVEHRGHGYAALAQAAWSRDVAGEPHDLLIGTINGLNAVSRASAVRAGRRRVLDLAFVAL